MFMLFICQGSGGGCACTLLFSETPQNWLPGSYIQFVRFSGSGLEADVVDERQFNYDLRTTLHTLDTFLQTLFPSRPVPVSTLREKQLSPYPSRAIRELLMNAVMHRDYQSNAPIRFYWFSDHIEIQNPGGLYGAATDFPNQNDYRNPKIAEAMKNLGYVNRLPLHNLHCRKTVILRQSSLLINRTIFWSP